MVIEIGLISNLINVQLEGRKTYVPLHRPEQCTSFAVSWSVPHLQSIAKLTVSVTPSAKAIGSLWRHFHEAGCLIMTRMTLWQSAYSSQQSVKLQSCFEKITRQVHSAVSADMIEAIYIFSSVLSSSWKRIERTRSMLACLKKVARFLDACRPLIRLCL